MTVSDSTICADILKKFDEAIRHGLGAAKVNAFATDPNKIQRDQSTYDLSSLEVQQFSRDIEADRFPPPTKLYVLYRTATPVAFRFLCV